MSDAEPLDLDRIERECDFPVPDECETLRDYCLALVAELRAARRTIEQQHANLRHVVTGGWPFGPGSTG